MDDDQLSGVLAGARVIAIVGASPRPDRDSHEIMAYLQAQHFQIRPINPLAAGSRILGEQVRARLVDLTERIDIINIFRRNEALVEVIDDVIAARPRIGSPLIWMQLGVNNPQAVAGAEAAGLHVIADRCIKIDHVRLLRRASDR